MSGEASIKIGVSRRRWPWRWMLFVPALLLLLVPVTAATPAHDAAQHTVRIEAGQYQFDPGVVHVRRGDTVTIELVATDVVHGLYLDGYDLQITADPGQTARLTFVADRAGSFRFRCSVSCGAMHPFMIGKLQVGSNWLFWGGLALAFVAAMTGLALAHRRPS